MIGFLIGTLCLIGLFKVLRHGRHRGWGGPRFGGWHGGACGGRYDWHEQWHERGWRGRFGGFGAGAFLRSLSRQLDATPAQEKVIREAADEVRSAVEKLRGEGRATRADVAKAVRSASFDETLLGELFARHDSALESVRKAIVGALARVHAVLDEGQRERLARILEDGPFARRWRGEHAWL